MKTSNQKISVSSNILTFRIDVNFGKADVDMVYKEIRAKGYQGPIPSILVGEDKHEVVGNSTPTYDTVEFALLWLAGFVDRKRMCTTSSKWDKDYSKRRTVTLKDGFQYSDGTPVKTELEKLGIEVTSWHGLMMGTCHLECEIDSEKYSKELRKRAEEIVQNVFKRFVRYHK